MAKKNMLPTNARLYITFVIASGLAILLLAAKSWSSPNIKQFAIYLGLAALASTLKIRIPGIESTITPSFIFVTLAINACGFSEVVAIAVVAAVVQSLFASAKRPRLVQVAFSAAALIIGVAAAFELSHLLLTGNAWASSVGTIILAGSVYFPVSAALVAVVLGLISGQSFRQILDNCDVSTFPYFIGGIAFAALVTSGSNPSSGWKGPLLLIPVVILTHFYFKRRFAQRLVGQLSA